MGQQCIGSLLSSSLPFLWYVQDLTPSDYATGLMLLGIQQHMQDHAATEAAAAAEEGHAAGVGGGGKVRDASSIVPGTATAATRAKTRQADKYRTTRPPLALSPDGPSLDTLKDAEFYFKHACAVYGWPMHLWMHKRKPAQ